MAKQKATAANIPQKTFCDPPVSRLQAVWLDGPVPSGYWGHAENRRLYVRWLGQRLGFQKPEDWYRITTRDFIRNHGGGILNGQWGGSAIAAVKECFPDYDWKEWLFGMASLRFWKNPKNRRRYIKWLGKQLGIRRSSDWYRVNNRDLAKHNGGALLTRYDSTVSRAIISLMPKYEWKEWLFSKTPKGFWHEKKNRRRYVLWLGKRLGYKSRKDWYGVTDDDFHAHHGIQFLRLYGHSPIGALKDCFPRYPWKEWVFARVPKTFWDDPKNRKRYLDWLGKRLNFRKPQDWRKVRRSDFLSNDAGGLLARYDSYIDLVKECIPGFK